MDVEPIVVHSDGTRPIIHVRDDIPNAQDKRAVRLALAANRAAELDLAWDVEVLAGLDADVLDGLWTADELSDLGQQWADEQKAAQEDPGAQVDKAEELQAKWNVQAGRPVAAWRASADLRRLHGRGDGGAGDGRGEGRGSCYRSAIRD